MLELRLRMILSHPPRQQEVGRRTVMLYQSLQNRAFTRITLVRSRQTSCPLKERSNHILLETLGACSGHTNNVEIFQEVVSPHIEEKHCEGQLSTRKKRVTKMTIGMTIKRGRYYHFVAK